MIELIIQQCIKFKEKYYKYKKSTDGQWRIQHNALFSRLESFILRCADIHTMTKTISEYNKLEEIVIGGTKGK